MDENDARVHFEMSSGQRKSDLLVQDCFDGLTAILHGQYVQVQGKAYRVKILSTQNNKILFDIKDLPGFDHIEFCIEKTGWGRDTQEQPNKHPNHHYIGEIDPKNVTVSVVNPTQNSND